jgi:UDP-glucose 4-epimerase
MEAYFAKHSGDSAFDACVHFAGLKAVGESVQKPLLYYNNNVTGTIVLLEQLKKSGCNNIVFSSSATVYGDPDVLPITEASPVGKITNPYGQTKYFIEIMLKDVAHTDKDMRVAVLRYFNPFGAHASGLIGEDPNGIPNNLTPYIAQVAVGKRPHLTVFGNDYDTVDGTGVRDYIHVVDLAKGHVAALAHSIYKPNATTNYDVFNLGTGKGVSVLEMLAAMSVACGKQLKHVMGPRRAGDVPTVYADCTKAETELHWKATKTVEEAMADTWRWQSQNPNGFSSL